MQILLIVGQGYVRLHVGWKRDYIDRSPLMNAVDNGNKDMVVALLDGGTDPNARTKNDNLSPLHHAVWTKNKGIVEVLLDKGASPLSLNRIGISPF